jgi:hypothetical protein
MRFIKDVAVHLQLVEGPVFNYRQIVFYNVVHWRLSFFMITSDRGTVPFDLTVWLGPRAYGTIVPQKAP